MSEAKPPKPAITTSPRVMVHFTFKLATETLIALARSGVLPPEELRIIINRGIDEARDLGRAGEEGDAATGAMMEQLLMELSASILGRAPETEQ